MCSKAAEHKNQYFTTDFIHKEPVWLNVTFPCSFVVAGQIMVSISCIQCTAVGKNIHDLKQLIQIFLLLLYQLQILLKLVYKLYLVLHFSNAALRSSMLV